LNESLNEDCGPPGAGGGSGGVRPVASLNGGGVPDDSFSSGFIACSCCMGLARISAETPDGSTAEGQVSMVRYYRSPFAGHRHPADQDRTGADMRSRIDIAANRFDRGEHLLEVA